MRIHRKKTALSTNRWSKYAVAGAAGAVVALVPQAYVDADITVVNVNVRLDGMGTIATFGPYTFGTGSGFNFAHAGDASVGTLLVFGGNSMAFAGFTVTNGGSSYRYASNLPYGQVVSQVPDFLPNGSDALLAAAPGYPSSQFRESGRGFLGFRFDVGNGTQYGYAEVIMDGEPGNTATFVKYAWADSGESIRAGQVPEPGTLGFLALGSVGLLAWRRKRSIPVYE